MHAGSRLVIAVDLSQRSEILRLVDELHGIAGIFKIGLQAFIANGPTLVQEIVGRGERVFLDLKIHDIPNTAMHAVKEAVSLGVEMLTVHALGGSAMLTGCSEWQGDAAVLAVTILTSLDQPELERVGLSGTPDQNAVRLALLAKTSGLRGVVASPFEIAPIRAACGSDLLIVTPGIRPTGSAPDDQRRTMTPRQAMAAGADFIVIGRPVTAAPNRREAALRIADEIS